MVGKNSGSLEVGFSANDAVRTFANAHPRQLLIFTQVESLRSSLHELEGLLEGYSTLMSGPTEKAVDNAIKYGAVFAEVSRPRST